jgi:hypothetical protein
MSDTIHPASTAIEPRSQETRDTPFDLGRKFGRAVGRRFGCLVIFVAACVGCVRPSGSRPVPGGEGGDAPVGDSTGAAATTGTAATSGAAAATGAAASTGEGGNVGAAGATGTTAPGGASGSTTPIDGIAFSPSSRTFQGALQVAMTTPSGSYDIRYTTDGQAPTASSKLYDGRALQLTATTQIRAEAFVGGASAHVTGTGLYIARTFDVSIELPVVVVDTYGHGALSPDDRSFVDAAFMTFDPSGSSTALSSPPTLAARAGVHVRGQTSAWFLKPPYRVELRGSTDVDQDNVVLGMPAESDWVLHSPFPDKALIRNAFVYSLGRDMGMPAPRFAFAELYVNVGARPLASGDYAGVYLLVETIKNHKDRLDLEQLKPKDVALPALSGGYIFKFELYAAAPPTLTCIGPTWSCWKDLEVIDPEPLQPAQQTWLTQYIQSFHDALNGPRYTDPAAGYAAYINAATFVDQIIIHELSRNVDAYVRSQYFYKDRDARISAGPLWDYDLSFDVGGLFDNRNLEGWQYAQNAVRDQVSNTWFQRLLTDPAFTAEVVARWKSLRQGLLSDAQVDARIYRLTAGLANAAARNFARWPILTAVRVGPFDTPIEPTWQGQVEHMRAWAKSRMAWLDAQWM